MAIGYLIGIDIGTQGTKTSLISVDGTVISESFEQSRLIYPEKGAVEQEPDEIYLSCLRTIKEAVIKADIDPKDILALGIDGQMAGILGIDKDWNAVTPYDSWLDNRCSEYKDLIKEWDAEKVVSISGCPAMIHHAPKIMWWKNKRPESYARINKFIMPGAYVAGRMCGLKSDKAYIDYTYLHFTGLSDLKNLKWSDELLNAFGIEKSKMPEIVEPWKIIGTINSEAAAQCGLKQGTPVIAGCGDTSATAYGAGIVEKGIAFDVAGTASVFSCCVDEYSPDINNKTLIFAKSVIPGLWNPMAYISGGGLCLKWLRDELNTKEYSYSYKELDVMAAGIPAGSEELIFIPHFNGRLLPDVPNIRGSWMGLSWVHTKAHLYRSIMEGIAYEYKYYLSILKSLVGNIELSHVLAIGGGAKSRLFNSIKADVLGVPYSTQDRSDTATLGVAILAGYGAGIYNDLVTAIKGIVKHEGLVQPETKNADVYNRLSKVYEDSFEMFDKFYRGLLGSNI